MEPRLPNYAPQYQQTLDDEYKALVKKHEAELKRHADNSLYPPRDGVPWSKRYSALVTRQNEEAKIHHQKQVLYNKVKAIIHGETVLPVAPDIKAEKLAKYNEDKAAVQDRLKDMRYQYLKNGEPKPGDDPDAFQMHWLYKMIQHEDKPELSVLYRDALKEDFGHTDQSIDYAMATLKELEPKKVVEEKPEETDREKHVREMRDNLDDIFSKKKKRGLSL